ncbi:tripartite tricarboxylate transporter TctB family protein [Halobacillus andaensis]|uniref:tripartite tricarboxylate transporter TctB family protein n=1 Tax=Halobacillus andaensis TaxID=1176239 RepID=UPI003D75F8C9
MHENKLVDLYSSVILIVFSIVLFSSTFTFQRLTVSQIGSDFAPRIVAVLLFVLSVVLLIQAALKLKAEKTDQVEHHQAAEESKQVQEKPNYWRVLLSIGLIVVYLALMTFLGFLITTAVYLFCQFYLMAPETNRTPLALSLISTIITVVVYFTFKEVFNLMLPAGILG